MPPVLEVGAGCYKTGPGFSDPRFAFLEGQRETMAKEMWGKVKDEYKKKSKMVMVDLWRKLQDKPCTDGGDVKAHLNTLHTIWVDLIAIFRRQQLCHNCPRLSPHIIQDIPFGTYGCCHTSWQNS
jgi:hypothetical protein